MNKQIEAKADIYRTEISHIFLILYSWLSYLTHNIFTMAIDAT